MFRKKIFYLLLDEQFRADGFNGSVASVTATALAAVDVVITSQQFGLGFRCGEIGRCGRQRGATVRSVNYTKRSQ